MLSERFFIPDSPGPHYANRAHQRAAHVVGLHSLRRHARPTHTQLRFCPVAALRLLGKRLAALAFAVDVACQFPILELGLRRL